MSNVTKIPLTDNNETLMILSEILEKERNKEITNLIIAFKDNDDKINEYYTVTDYSWAITRLELLKLDILTQIAMSEEGDDEQC